MTDTLTDRRDPRQESLYLSWNIPFELVELPLADIRVLEGAQVRDLGNIAPSEGVTEYATHMRAGAKFPPIAVMRPNILIDGNTRLGAARSNRFDSTPAYLLEISTVDVAKAVAAALNQLNGRRLTSAEVQKSALIMLRELHLSDDAVAAAIGRSSQMVRIWRRYGETEAHASRLNLDEHLDKVSKNQRDVLASVTLDAPFAELVKLTSDIKVPNSELRRVVKAVTAASSDADALEVVAAARKGMVAVGPEPRRAQINVKARRARMIVPQVLNLRPADLFDAAKAEEDRKMWLELQEFVGGVLSMYDQRAAVGALNI
jgi:hypothetical protein